MNFIIKINMFYREKNKRKLTYQKVSYKEIRFCPQHSIIYGKRANLC